MRVGYEMHMERANEVHSVELSITISYPTNTNGIEFFFIKNAHKISRILPDFNCRNNRFQAFFNF